MCVSFYKSKFTRYIFLLLIIRKFISHPSRISENLFISYKIWNVIHLSCKTVPQVRRSVADLSLQRPRFNPRDLW
jgi:hypothetical protein